jgi:hypothetical protein
VVKVAEQTLVKTKTVFDVKYICSDIGQKDTGTGIFFILAKYQKLGNSK